MSSNTLDFDIDAIMGNIVGTVQVEAARTLRLTEARILQTIDRENAKMFAHMVEAGIDTEGPPELAEFSPSWDPLSEEYSNWKQKKYGHVRHFKNTGQLGHLLGQKKTGKLFGKAQMNISGGQRVLAPGITQTGRQFRRKGKFISSKDAFKDLETTFIIKPFPEWDPYSNITDQLRFRNNETKHKLNRISQRGRDRPFVENYMHWWTKYVLLPRVKRMLI
jgi:hypothetical protein